MPGAVAVVGLVLISVGEALAWPLAMSRVAGDVHWRLSALAVGLMLVVQAAPRIAMGVVRQGLPEQASEAVDALWTGPVLWAGVVLAGMVGVAALAAAIPLQRRLWSPAGGPAVVPPEDEPTEEAPIEA
jgi:dipeptide/tripeptide permease